MRIVVVGGTGFIGRRLVQNLTAGGHDVVVLTRSRGGESLRRSFDNTSLGTALTAVVWPGDTEEGTKEKSSWIEALEGADSIVNLAGTSIAVKRWTREQKLRILTSRQQSTRRLVEAIGRLKQRPKVLLNASAVGYYGPCGDEVITESHPAGNDFLSQVCQTWEAEAQRAEAYGVRIVFLRTGIVLDPAEGALQQMLLPFRLFLGGPLGSGKQWMPWIHIEDQVGLIRHLLTSEKAQGPYNLTSPHPATNGELSSTIGRLLHRPSFFPAPASVLRLVLGEMAQPLLLSGQRAVPHRALESGYAFTFPHLEAALRSLLLHSGNQRKP